MKYIQNKIKNMTTFKSKLDRVKCRLELLKLPAQIIFFVIGFLSTILFLIRVIPKPSRANYPCVRATAPFMSEFVIWLLSLAGSVLIFKKAFEKLITSKYLAALGFIVIGIILLVTFNYNEVNKLYARSSASTELPDGPNNPMGKSYGIFPGRVVWVYN